ncbi:hypothetical protein C8E03_108161 [Lachnotalea glycerini]|uniref:XRE family transcriptional regulator n=1 Tax=Lachnotalea glycerini TaxID=1763509 RepID=A0A318EUI0_9FIRM|nr:transcriptional regulator [Lachnotalea glycerini]PXV88434.1 hypothetical protein C8E03_108161 [Lachnotalea glycerini]
MGMAEEIRILLVKNSNMSVSALAKLLETTPQNLNYKLKYDDFRESELRKIADLLGYELKIGFVKKKVR